MLSSKHDGRSFCNSSILFSLRTLNKQLKHPISFFSRLFPVNSVSLSLCLPPSLSLFFSPPPPYSALTPSPTKLSILYISLLNCLIHSNCLLLSLTPLSTLSFSLFSSPSLTLCNVTSVYLPTFVKPPLRPNPQITPSHLPALSLPPNQARVKISSMSQSFTVKILRQAIIFRLIAVRQISSLAFFKIERKTTKNIDKLDSQ